jgi:DMSO/TMAO reductase YedYZ molybdopterin-dependent catalytic subunit
MSAAKPGYMRNFFTPADAFYEVTRSKPYQLSREEQARAGLTPETWRLEIVPDHPPWQPTLKKTCTKADNTAITMKDLEEIFSTRPVRSIKLLQCLLDHPDSGFCSNGFWEGVALRDVLARLGRLTCVRRIYYSGYYKNEKECFVSSLSLSEVLETPPGHIPVFLAFRLNGAPLPIERGGPVRMLVPEAYGFKSIKWLNQIVLTNDFRPNDSYAVEFPKATYCPDPQAPMKTLARLDVHANRKFKSGEPITVYGIATVGVSGLKRVEYWLREDKGTHGRLDPDDPAWATADWKPVPLAGQPPKNWTTGLSVETIPRDILFVDSDTRLPTTWPLPFSWVQWSVSLGKLPPDAYEFRARAVDLNGFAQPEPRPNPQSGIAEIQCQTFVVS